MKISSELSSLRRSRTNAAGFERMVGELTTMWSHENFMTSSAYKESSVLLYRYITYRLPDFSADVNALALLQKYSRLRILTDACCNRSAAVVSIHYL